MKQKISALFNLVCYAVVYGLVVFICISYFENSSYSFVYVEGASMLPTLNLNLTSQQGEYGYVDLRESTINKMKRFDIVVTYFPWESKDYKQDEGETYDHRYTEGESPLDTAVFKIKRVLAFPGETINIINSVITITDANGTLHSYDCGENISEGVTRLPFERNFSGKSKTQYNLSSPITLGDKEYWVQGDHWGSSSDCYFKNTPIYRGNIKGVLRCIQGYGTIHTYYCCSSCNTKYESYTSTCTKCSGTSFKTKEELIDKVKYDTPRYF